MNMSSDIDIFGIYMSPMVPISILALIIQTLLRKIFGRFAFYRGLWGRSVMELAVYILIVAALLFCLGGPTLLPLWS